MHAIVLADGEIPARAALDATWPGWADAAAYVVAADGGARHADALGLTLDHWVGDGDSLDPAGLERVRATGLVVSLAPADKDESDTELAVEAALESGATRLTIVGALGGPRLDHALANIGLLALPGLRDVDARIVGSTARLRMLTGPGQAELGGRVGDLVSLFPVGADAVGVTTSALRYPLTDATLRVGRTRGLSNVRLEAVATVAVDAGRLLIVEAPATL